ncbi:unnamed protein product [Heligmosomoides polygyrus]|uniref:Uncharacterized protein n=1 Tax=Heligmosomoides polygyrus TaxID=6339 RepID=A0A183GUX3_HELPZ|nr:unnamed protein product [Heligmosomoides polygyrus]
MSSQEAQHVVIDSFVYQEPRMMNSNLELRARSSWSPAAAAASRITSPVCMETELFKSTSSASANSKPAPEDFRTKESLMKAITLLAPRNELLTVADKDPDVWQHFDTYSKAQSMKISHPFLAEYLMNKKAEEKKTHLKALAWKRSFSYGQRTSQPFRAGRATWALAPPSDFQFNPYPQQQRMQYPGAGFKAP